MKNLEKLSTVQLLEIFVKKVNKKIWQENPDGTFRAIKAQRNIK